MGIIDKSITYTFFYSFPIALVLLFFLPFYKAEFSNKVPGFTFLQKILWFFLAIIISFNGPLIPGIVLIVCPLILAIKWKNAFNESHQDSFRQRVLASFDKIPRPLLFYFLLAIVLGAYSFFIGMHNSENGDDVSLLTRFSRLPEGLLNPFIRKLGFPLLTLMIAINVFFLWKNKQDAMSRQVLGIIKWIGIFILFYLVLLPLGGYREYRPDILRHDTLMPITLCMIFMYGAGTCWLIQLGSSGFTRIYSVAIVIVCLVFTNADRLKLDENECEKNALYQIARSQEQIVALKDNCLVIEWHTVRRYRDSELNSRLLQLWRITGERKWYYQNEP
jgi:hypothetical protein